ncbi:MAG TPA: ABC transporter ATP-binding protein [Micromonosporaceae bacterium]|jgi:NitT/TauT family transport system ATP-binding protein
MTIVNRVDRSGSAAPSPSGSSGGGAGGGPVFEIRNVVKRFGAAEGGLLVLDGIDLTVERDTFTSIVGPSGCGKSTLLRLLAGLDRPTGGEVLLNGAPHGRNALDVGYVSQDDTLLPWLSVLSNVMLPLRFRDVPKQERRDRALDVLRMVGLESFTDYYPHQLSGGMQKRCIIARALVYNPPVLLLDEPFGPLDALTRLGLQQELLGIWERTQQTAVFVTHDIVEAVALSDRVVVMGRNPGRIRDDLQVDLDRPRMMEDVPSSERFDAIRRRIWLQLSPEIGLANGSATDDAGGTAT